MTKCKTFHTNRVVVLTLTMIAVVSQTSVARADLVLTADGMARGFSLTTFATGFPNILDIGPLGIEFPSSGGVLVSDRLGNVRHFPTNTDGQNAGSVPVGQNYRFQNASGLAKVGSAIYMAQEALGRVVQINDDGAFNQSIVDVRTAVGIAANPMNGHLFVSNVFRNQIFEVDPIAKTSTLFVNISDPDGILVSSDGSILYVAARGLSGGGHIVGLDIMTKAQVFDSGSVSGVDGIALERV